ncbi:hypothetical protein E2P84_03795 [Burkholderia cepacia]|uniref:hypothetical protein n=1 Tax=Burkholderia cepacia TaxID=292 RepID=UPI001067EB02|nr:hypothetical protein [Burkholderia cepacia]TES82276.1 hypothetical protein E2P84_03795 [Burkholderia cepacia]
MQDEQSGFVVAKFEHPGDIKMVMFDSASKGLTIVMENGEQFRLEQRYSATHAGFGNGYGGAFITLAALLLAQHERITALERAAAIELPISGSV